MNRQQIEKVMLLMGRTPTDTQGEWIHCECPLAEWEHESGTDVNPSFGILVGPGDSRCHCFSCDYSGDVSDLVLELSRRGLRFPYMQALEVVVEAEESAGLEFEGSGYEADVFAPHADHDGPHVYPEEFLERFESAGFESGDGVYELHPYLSERRVTVEVAQRLLLMWDPYRKRVLFPVRDFKGRLRGVHGRHDPDYPFAAGDVSSKYKMYPWRNKTNSHVWLGEHFVDLTDTVLVAESVFDLCRALEVYPNSVSPLTASLSRRKVGRLVEAARIVTLFDTDKAGDRARKRLHDWLPGSEIVDVILPPGKDAADMDTDRLRELCKSPLGL